MGKVRASAFSVSLDGFGAGPDQDLQHPFGVGGMELPNWLLKTRMFHEMIGQEGGTTDTDDHFARKSMEHVRASIMGRNMFGRSAANAATIPGRPGGEAIRPIPS